MIDINGLFFLRILRKLRSILIRFIEIWCGLVFLFKVYILNFILLDLDSRNDLRNIIIYYFSGFVFKIFIMILIK